MPAQKICWTLLFLAILSGRGLAQQWDCVDQLPAEKVVLQIDKERCLAGDSLWFIAYCLQADGKVSTLSKVLYVEIFDAAKKIFVQQKFKLTDGKSHGTIAIPESVTSGYYFLRAYTQYMRNYSPLDYYYQRLMIVNPELEPGSIAAGNNRPPIDQSAISMSISTQQ